MDVTKLISDLRSERAEIEQRILALEQEERLMSPGQKQRKPVSEARTMSEPKDD